MPFSPAFHLRNNDLWDRSEGKRRDAVAGSAWERDTGFSRIANATRMAVRWKLIR
jgi:hypothetical protein